MTILETLPGVHRWCCTWCGRPGRRDLITVVAESLRAGA